MKQSERTAPESRIREIRSYGLNEGERETVIAYEALNPYPLSTLPAVTLYIISCFQKPPRSLTILVPKLD